MKLLFPNDEHTPVELGDGTVLVGSAADCAIRLAAPGIAARHCELITEGEQTLARPLTGAAATVLNGKQIVGETPIKAGDLLLFGKVGCRIVGSPRRQPLPVSEADADDDMGHTRVRMAMPKFLLRGVSGPTFGKVYAMVGTLSVGRSAESDICIASDEISRQHARVQSSAGGIVVEDLGSANGTFINDKRIHTATVLNPGDEVRFDTVRFLLMAPAQEAQQAAAAARPVPAPPSARSASALWIAAGVAVLIAVVLGVLRYLGKV
jgi:pSer/pThr/pTyr-binding forkhead associated (FHA) protein